MYSQHIMKHFSTTGVDPDLYHVAEMFHNFAHEIHAKLQPGLQRAEAMTKLLEARDYALRQKREDVDNAVRDARIAEVKDHLIKQPIQEVARE